MSMKEIDNVNPSKAFVKRRSAHKLHTNKYIGHLPNKRTTKSVREKGTDKYENANTRAAAMEVWRKRDHEPSTLLTYCRLKVCAYKKARQSRQ